MKKIVHKIFLLSILIISFENISFSQKISKKIILISKDYKSTIHNWLSHTDASFTYKEIYRLPSDSLEFYLAHASGCVIGGGNDVNPAMYGMSTKINKCGKLDTRRDTLEYKMILFALQNKIPLLGICRGNQIMNVSTGGSLVVDIPSETKSKIPHRSRKKHAHEVSIHKNTSMYDLIKEEKLKVNSNHHQAIEKISDYFIPFALADDGIIEGIEIKSLREHPFAVGVQWHPELLVHDTFSEKLAKLYLSKCLNKY